MGVPLNGWVHVELLFVSLAAGAGCLVCNFVCGELDAMFCRFVFVGLLFLVGSFF